MESLVTSINVTLPIVIMLTVGYVLRRIGMMNDNFIKIANSLNFRVFLPCSLFVSLYCKTFSIAKGAGTMLAAFLAYTVTFIIGCLLVPRLTDDNAKRGTMATVFFRSNISYVGVPVVNTLTNGTGTYMMALVLTVAVPLGNILTTIGFSIFSGHKANFKKIVLDVLRNPCVIASVAGTVLMLLHCPQFPTAVHDTISSMGKVCTPLALVSIGGSLDFSKLGINKKLLIWGNACCLVVFPLIGTLIFVLCGFRNESLASLYALMACPVATLTFAVAQSMGGDGELASEQIVSQSILSVATIFIGVFILKSLQLL